MEAIQYLQQLQRYDSMIRRRINEIRHLEELSLQIGSRPMDGIRVQSSGGTSRQESMICSKLEAEKKLKAEIREYQDKRSEIVEMLDQLPECESDILYRVYASGESLKEVAFERGESYSKIARRHRSALVLLQQLLDEREAEPECHGTTL